MRQLTNSVCIFKRHRMQSCEKVQQKNLKTNPTGKIKHYQICISLHTSQGAQQVGAYPGFRGMKRLGIFLLPPGWDASPSPYGERHCES